MEQRRNHRITVCTSCKFKGTNRRPGFELIEKLRVAVEAKVAGIPNDFQISGVACMAGCERPCAVAYQGTDKATYLFGDIDPETDVEALVAFAQQYAELLDGWCSSLDRPFKLRQSTLARVPAAIASSIKNEARAS